MRDTEKAPSNPFFFSQQRYLLVEQGGEVFTAKVGENVPPLVEELAYLRFMVDVGLDDGHK